MEIDPGSLDRRSRYALLTDLVVPRPIAWVVSRDRAGKNNLAPFSFFGGISASPPLIGISIGRRRGQKKDTLRNLEATGEAVVHIPTEELAETMVLTSGDFAPEVDELELAGLTPIGCTHVQPPRIAEAPVAMECRLEQLLALGDPGEPNGFAILRVLIFHIRDDLLEEGRVLIDRFRPVGRLGGIDYCRLSDRFGIPRPDPVDALARLGQRRAGAGNSPATGSDSQGSREDMR